MYRRRFMKDTILAASVPLVLSNTRAKAAPTDRITVAVAGVRGRGDNLLRVFSRMEDVDVKYICDVDETVLRQRIEETAESTGRRPEPLHDFRHALDDSSVDALVLGTPDHWHAIPTIMACQAEKDVYTEKPDGHNMLEGRAMVAAAKKYHRIVQLGTQARSSAYIHRALDYLREGRLGRTHFAKAWESAKQGSIGHPADCDPPEGVDYDFWLGPAPKRQFNPCRFHGNWRWFFDYGTGDLGNDGVHRLDYARWAFETAIAAQGGGPLGWPLSVSAQGGKFYFDDDQEWPDTLSVTYQYPHHILTYEMRIWTPYSYHDEKEGAVIYGDNGYLVISNHRWRAFDAQGKLVVEDSGENDTVAHIRNFLDCMRSRERPAADLETIGHPSSMLCHLGNLSWRTGRSVRFDPETYTVTNDEEANQYRTRLQYREPWHLPDLEKL